MNNNPIAEIFSQGEEVITGQVVDTNAAWLSEHLVQMGFVMTRHTAVGDKLSDLCHLLNEISERADLCICTGGLGPTVDDLTAEAVASAFSCALQLDPIALIQIENYFSSRHKEMVASNFKQAYLPKDALRLENKWGTAPGFALQQKRCWFVFLPGVPTEMRAMFNDYLPAELEKRFTLKADKLITIKSIGIGEADLQQKLNDFPLPEGVQLGFRATANEVQTKLLFAGETPEERIKQCVEQLVKRMGDAVFAVDESNKPSTDLVSLIAQLMNKKNYTLTLLETVSQGLISAKCVGHHWLKNSLYQQSIDPLLISLNITLEDNLALTAIAIAKKLKQINDSDLILVQLYQGVSIDNDHSIELYNTLLTPSGIYQKTLMVSGSIQRKQNQAAVRSLDLLRRYLQNKCL